MGSASEAVRDMENSAGRARDTAKDKVNDVTNQAKSSAQDLYDSAGTAVKDFAKKVTDTAGQGYEQAKQGYEQAKNVAHETMGQAEATFKNQPGITLLGAALAGFMVGMLVARK